jgi:hypothetical protein
MNSKQESNLREAFDLALRFRTAIRQVKVDGLLEREKEVQLKIVHNLSQLKELVNMPDPEIDLSIDAIGVML